MLASNFSYGRSKNKACRNEKNGVKGAVPKLDKAGSSSVLFLGSLEGGFCWVAEVGYLVTR